MKEPRKVKPSNPLKAEKPGKPLTVTHAPQRYDDLPAAEDPATEEELRQGYTRIPVDLPVSKKKST
jgi:hypothetical protein